MSIRTQYDSDLEALKAALAEMGRSSADAVEDALEALCTADADAAAGIVKGDGRISASLRMRENFPNNSSLFTFWV